MPLRVFVDRLKTGKEEIIDATVDSSQLFDKKEDTFCCPIQITGKAYLAGTELVVELEGVRGSCQRVCVVCNEPFVRPLQGGFVRHTIETKSIRGAVWTLGPLVRAEIMLGLEDYPKCGDGICLQQEDLKKYFKVEHGSTT